jgi:hypothetical protein
MKTRAYSAASCDSSHRHAAQQKAYCFHKLELMCTSQMASRKPQEELHRHSIVGS